MKKIFLTALAVLAMVGAMAQGTKLAVPMGVYVPNDQNLVPEYAQSTLESKMRQIVTVNGMGASNAGTFFITCDVNILDKHVLGGSPIRISQKTETTFYIADAQTQRIYETATFTSEGIGQNENQAFVNSFNQIDVRSSQMRNFVAAANKKIIDYYESQIDNLISQAEAQAKLGMYDDALFILCAVPDACPSFKKVNDAALRIYQIMIDKESLEALQAAKAVWAAAHTYESAQEAAEYLALISPYSTCVDQADKLAAEIKAFVAKEHEYDKALQEKLIKMEYDLEKENIKAWRDVGVAYGQNQQQTVVYNRWW